MLIVCDPSRLDIGNVLALYHWRSTLTTSTGCLRPSDVTAIANGRRPPSIIGQRARRGEKTPDAPSTFRRRKIARPISPPPFDQTESRALRVFRRNLRHTNAARENVARSSQSVYDERIFSLFRCRYGSVSLKPAPAHRYWKKPNRLQVHIKLS